MVHSFPTRRSSDLGVGKPFGVLLSLRFTNSVDRETGGFSKYLQNGFFGRVGTQYRQINYRDELQKNIEGSFGKDFEVNAIGFFDAFMPPRGVVEEGQEGWLEKPLAYIVLTRKDPAIDTVPAVSMDMQFTDQTGPVTLAVPSNTPLLAAGDAGVRRACQDLEVSQLVDVRAIGEPTGDGAKDVVTLEVRMRGKGVVPDVREVLAGLDAPLAGYELAKDGVVADPPIVLASGDASSSPMMMMRAGGPQPPKEGYPEPDKDGMYRLPIERSFKVTYARGSGAVGGEFRLPTLVAGVDAKLESRFYDDLDIMPVVGASVPVELPTWTTARIVRYALYLVFAFAVSIWWHRSRRAPAPQQAPAWAPSRITPLGVVTGLRRLEQGLPADKAKALRDEIVLLELKYFGPNAADSSDQELRAVVEKWQKS